MRPDASEYAPFYERYVALVPGADVLAVLREQQDEVAALARAVPSRRETYAYAPGKWSVREVVGHATDAERVFGYRAFAISRGETQPLPSFDENGYAAHGTAGARPLALLVDEWQTARRLNLALFEALPDVAWGRTGTASGKPITVRALAFLTAGHLAHHLGILRERYGVG